MRAVAVTIPSAINPSPTMEISTSIFSRMGIGLEGFMSCASWPRHIVDRTTVGRGELGHIARERDWNARLVAYRVPVQRYRKQYETPAPPVNQLCPGAELLTIGILIATEHSSIQALTEFHFRFGANR
jgi:hypothetical protein